MTTDTRDPKVTVLDHLAEALKQPVPTDGDYRDLSYRLLEEHHRNLATDPGYRARYYQVLVECELHGTQPAEEVAIYVCMHPLILETIKRNQETATND
jgi:hypothetical protein